MENHSIGFQRVIKLIRKFTKPYGERIQYVWGTNPNHMGMNPKTKKQTLPQKMLSQQSPVSDSSGLRIPVVEFSAFHHGTPEKCQIIFVRSRSVIPCVAVQSDHRTVEHIGVGSYLGMPCTHRVGVYG